MIDDLGVPFPDTFDTAADLIDWFYDVKEARDAKYPDRAENPIAGGGTADRLDSGTTLRALWAPASTLSWQPMSPA